MDNPWTHLQLQHHSDSKDKRLETSWARQRPEEEAQLGTCVAQSLKENAIVHTRENSVNHV